MSRTSLPPALPDPRDDWRKLPPRLLILVVWLRCAGYLGALAGALVLLLHGLPLETAVGYATAIAFAGAVAGAQMTAGLVPVRLRTIR
ncbi:hypothetical protein ABZS29_38495 [Kribbella sp. NPDC005582]|uniref:hypothetical protein n=1 Tax=Kribbella sp. NPDC005582 TaxID=3156893 RepID=UPI0033A6BF45